MIKEEKLVKLLIKRNMTIAFAESITGGLCAATLINVDGASNVIKESIVTYSNEAKNKYLDVPFDMINKYGVVSPQVAIMMAIGIKNQAASSIGVGVTGYAGEYGDEFTKGKTVFFAISKNDTATSYEYHFDGLSRNEIRHMIVDIIFEYLLSCLDGE